jgi:hypothetical protein
MSTLEALPELLDARRIREEMGITDAAAEKLMRMIPVVDFESRGLRKKYVRRADLVALIEQQTFTKDQVPPR